MKKQWEWDKLPIDCSTEFLCGKLAEGIGNVLSFPPLIISFHFLALIPPPFFPFLPVSIDK